MDGWDSNQGYGKAYILTGETPSAGTSRAFDQDDMFGNKAVVIEKLR